jgi:ATP-dependent DNA ligase
MYALALQRLPEGKDWLYEVKFDGYRCLAGRDASGVTLWSRRGNLFTAQFPHIARACERLPSGTLIDGEIAWLWTQVAGFHLTFCNITTLQGIRLTHWIVGYYEGSGSSTPPR